MRISTKGKNAVEALLYMASQQEEVLWAIKTIAADTQIPERYLEQIFFLLRKANLLDTVRGPKGGYCLARRADEIKIGDILRAVEGDLLPVPCACCEEVCTCNIQDTCTTRGLWYKLAEAISSVVDNMSLQELANRYQQKEVPVDYENFY
ncbi:MAG: RrF2 family transcriptional regulator [Cellulosilyticaceae bacterium]